MKTYWLEALVLAVISKETKGDYAYNITNKIIPCIPLSESAIYHICKCLKERQFLSEYDENCDGRNRKYYQITENGRNRLLEYQKEWTGFAIKMNKLLI